MNHLTTVDDFDGPADAAHVFVVGIDAERGVDRAEPLDDGHGPLRRATGAEIGHGIIGMRERVAAYGGTLRAAPATAGGFEVVATIPYAPTTSASVIA